MVFFPLIEWFWDNGGVPVASQLTDDQMKSNLATIAAAVDGLSLEIDGKSYGSTVRDFVDYRTVWTQFSYTMPNTPTNIAATFPLGYGNGFWGAVPKSFCGGYWILLAPLSTGSHVIHFVGAYGSVSGLTSENTVDAAVETFSISAFTNDVTYNLTVE